MYETEENLGAPRPLQEEDPDPEAGNVKVQVRVAWTMDAGVGSGVAGAYTDLSPKSDLFTFCLTFLGILLTFSDFFSHVPHGPLRTFRFAIFLRLS